MADAVFLHEGSNGTCCFATGKILIARAVFQRTGIWQMLLFDRSVQMAYTVFRHEDCSYIADRAQYLQYLRVFPATYKSETKFNPSVNNVKFKNKLYVKFKVLRV